MRELKKRERAAMEAVAERFLGRWEMGDGVVHLFVGGKRVAVDVRTFKRRGGGGGGAVKPRLRFDKVATRVMERVRSAVGGIVPEGVVGGVTITAPIRLASKTAAAVEEEVRRMLECGATGRDGKFAIHGNGVRVRLLRGGSARAPKLIGFVHNSDTDPLRLLNMTRELLALGGEPAGRGARWLVVISGEGNSSLEAYRYIYSQLRVGGEYEKIVVVFGDGRVGMLAG